MKTYLVYDIGGTFIKYGLMNDNAEITKAGKVPAPTDSLENLIGAIKGVADMFPGEFEGIAISMPGRIDTEKGIAYTGGAYRFIKDCPFAEEVHKVTGVPVKIANDGKCAASAETWGGALSDVSNGCVIVLGTGTGGGIVLDHKVYMGSTGGAAELSNFIMDMYRFYDAPELSTGSMGLVWAGNTSATGLLMKYSALSGIPLEELDGLKFFEAYDNGDENAIKALDQFAELTAVGIFSLQSVMDLERYAIGGGISARKEITDSIRDKVEELYSRRPHAPFCKPEIVTCKYGNDANMIGALKFYLNDVQ